MVENSSSHLVKVGSAAAVTSRIQKRLLDVAKP